MTKRRDPLTDHSALAQIAELIGWDRCAAIVGRNPRTVRYWSDPDCETEIRRIDAERLDAAYLDAGGAHAPFHRLHGLRLGIATREAAGSDLAALAGETAREAGEAVAALIAVAQSPDPEVRRTARTELEEAIGKMTDALAAIPS